MSDIRVISTDDAPGAIGPYNQAVEHAGVVYCSGQIGLDPATGEMVTGGVEAQAERALTNLSNVLEAAGSGLDRALRLTVYVKDMNDFAAVNQIYGRFFDGDYPARATVEVARLPKDALVEIDAIAALK